MTPLSAWDEEEHVKRLQELCHPADATDDAAPVRRGFANQRPQRQRERDLRERVIDFSCWTRQHGWSIADIAIAIHLAPRTLRQWFADFHRDTSPLLPLGRPVLRSPRDERNAVLAVLDELGPATGLPTLQDAFPEMPRAELHNLLVRYRIVWQKRHHHAPHTLHWQTPGTVWAIDYSYAPTPIDGIFPYILAVRDLASHQQLLWQPASDMTHDDAIAALDSLFALHGPPLVLKSDNGSAFTDERTQIFLRSKTIFSLFSPPRTPRYNGAIEAGIGSLKSRSERHAQSHGHPADWTADDLAFAQAEANATARPKGPTGPTPDILWNLRTPITDSQRSAFHDTVNRRRAEIQTREGQPMDWTPNAAKERLMDRDAIRRALGEHELLLYSRRCIPLTIKNEKSAGIR